MLTRDSRGRLIVASITRVQAQGIYEVRATLESLAGRLCAERATDDQIRGLRSACDQLAEAAEAGNLGAFLEAKDRFYDLLLEGSHNDSLRTLLKTLYWRIVLLRRTSLTQPGRLRESLREIQAVVEAIERRDSRAAEQLCAAHVYQACEAAFSALQADGAQPAEAVDGTIEALADRPEA